MEIEWMEHLLPIILQVFDVLLKLVIIPAIVLAVKWTSERLKNNLIRGIIVDAILYAQQVFWDHGGEDKLEEAIAYAIRQLEAWNITLTRQEIIDLIEPLLKNLKDELADTWYEEGKSA